MNKLFKAALFSDDTGFYNEMSAATLAEQEARMNVYRNNVVVSLVDALGDIFPVSRTVVGEEFFHAMARVYVMENQPNSPVISEYGGNFSDFIRQFEPAKGVPFLADLAALEYAMLTLTNSEEFETLEHEAISQAFSSVEDPSGLTLSLPPTTQILESPFALGSLYRAHFSDDQQSLNQIDINKAEYLLLVKSHLYSQLHVLSRDEALFIKGLTQNKNLEEALPESETFDLGEVLAKLIQWKVITAIT
ncbi:DNA-binding domain-containing protein [Marinomonas sp. C2222]|uniref:DNA-binding domain-containing protein n=1 Tax=Marinomonas sargassi TaxID=2984494 RepID=A0ABT2YPJ3_9GAMM|nr:DNA-binding domain-containing protein [Marinomonas sargassi]MCV2401802.1 DNA-binding domain-containing protein [Marinomonas sargassi]